MDPHWYRVLPLVEEDRWSPACDVFSRDGVLVVRIELPGVEPDKDVQVTVDNGVLEVVVPKFAALPEPKRVPVHTAEADKSLAAGGA